MALTTTSKLFQKQVIFGLLLLLTCGGLYFVLPLLRRGNTPIAQFIPPTAPTVYRSLDGMPASATTSTLVGVMIDNAPEAWPQFGISHAQMVYEIPVEGARTRFMAIFDLATLDNAVKIGPVRSVRDVFLDVARELHLTPVHVGGSPSALSRVDAGEVKTLNQFFRDPYFYRTHVDGRTAPHNVLTTGALLKKAAGVYSFVVSDTASWKFDDGASKGEESVPKINYGEIKVVWNYDKEKNDYTRFVNGDVFKDAEGVAITAQNVVVMETDMRVVDEKLRRDIRTTGTGAATVYRDGEVLKGTWKRAKLSDRTTFFDANGNEIIFTRGVSWIEVVEK